MSIWSRLRKAVHELTGPTPAPAPHGRSPRAARERTKRRHARRARRTGITETVRRRDRSGNGRYVAWVNRYREELTRRVEAQLMEELGASSVARVSMDPETLVGLSNPLAYIGGDQLVEETFTHEHEWIDITTIGGEDEEFCPRCSEKRPKARDVVFSSPGYPTSWYGDRYRK